MKKYDEDLQNDIESGKQLADSPDVRAYRKVIAALEHKPNVLLSDDFAANVSARVQAKHASSLKAEYLWLSIGLIMIIVSTGFGIAFSGITINFNFLQAAKPLSGLFIFGVFFIVLIHVLDKRVLRVSKSQP